MKKRWSILLIFFLSTASFGNLLPHCSSCTFIQPTHCKPGVSQPQGQPSCHGAVPVKQNACYPSEKQTSPHDCQLCSGHDQPSATEEIIDTHIKSKFQFENIVAQASLVPTILSPEEKHPTLNLRSSPLVSSLVFLKTIRLLC